MDANEDGVRNNLDKLIEDGVVNLQALMSYTEDFNLGPYNLGAEERT